MLDGLRAVQPILHMPSSPVYRVYVALKYSQALVKYSWVLRGQKRKSDDDDDDADDDDDDGDDDDDDDDYDDDYDDDNDDNDDVDDEDDGACDDVDNGDGKKPQKEESSALNRQPTKSIEILTRAREKYPKISRNLVREVPRSIQNRSGTLLEHTRAKKTPKNRKSLVQK